MAEFPVKSGEFREIQGKSWEIMEIHGNSWKFHEIPGNCRMSGKYQEIPVKSVEIPVKSVEIPGNAREFRRNYKWPLVENNSTSDRSIIDLLSMFL